MVVDIPEREITSVQRELLERVRHPNRTVRFCKTAHRNYGNTCRHQAFPFVTGDYLLYLDDDDEYVGEVFRTLNRRITDEVWGVFPIERFGERFFNLPPGRDRTTSNQFFSRPLYPWPDNGHYAADSELIEFLRARHPYLVVDSPPLARVTQIGMGRP